MIRRYSFIISYDSCNILQLLSWDVLQVLIRIQSTIVSDSQLNLDKVKSQKQDRKNKYQKNVIFLIFCSPGPV